MEALTTFETKYFDRMMEHVKYAKEKGYDVVAASIYGSQNYALENENSDVDSYLIVMPKLEDFALNNKPISKELLFKDTGEHILLKDIRVFFDALLNADFHALEVATSKYTFILNWTYWANEKQHFDFTKEDVFTPVLDAFYYRALNCLKGALEKDKFEKLNWDKKQDRKTLVDIVLHYYTFIHAFYRYNEPFAMYSKGLQTSLLKVKSGEMSKEEALKRFDLKTMIYDMEDRWAHDRFLVCTQKEMTKNQLRGKLKDTLKLQFEYKFKELR